MNGGGSVEVIQDGAVEIAPREARTPRREPPREKPIPGSSRRRIVIGALAGLAVAAVFVAWRLVVAARVPGVLVAVSGRIDGDSSALAAKTGGRVAEIRVREGDRVKAGDVVATLDDQQVRAREEQARLAAQGAEAREVAARLQIGILEDQLQQSQLMTGQARVDAEGRVRQASADLAAAEADLAQQEASYQLASFDKDAYTTLAREGAASERQARQALAAADQQAAAVAAARRRVEAVRAAVTTARANLSNAGIRRAQGAAVQKQIAQQQAEIASASASAEQARSQLVEARANLRDLTIVAPFDGTVITRAVEPGEVVQAGTALVTLLDLTKVYLRGFIPEGQIGRVRLGQPARVYSTRVPHARSMPMYSGSTRKPPSPRRTPTSGKTA